MTKPIERAKCFTCGARDGVPHALNCPNRMRRFGSAQTPFQPAEPKPPALDPIALDIQAMLTKRLEKGRDEHGPWESDEAMTKDMIVETLEEVTDALIYIGRKLVALKKGGA